VITTSPEPSLFEPIPVSANPADERHTPAWLFDQLGETFDLDPAAPVDGPHHVPCRRYFTVLDDGLAQPWHGFIWLNPPYSNVTPWARRMIAHNHGFMLAPLASNTRWTIEALAATTAVTSLTHIQFSGPRETRHISYGVLLFAFGERARRAAARLPLTFTPIGASS
jgi:hypothetical protein